MNEPIVQHFAKAETSLKRIFAMMGIALVAMFTAVELVAILKTGFDLELMLLFLGVGICLWWSYSRERTHLRREAASIWQVTDRGLEWTEPPNGRGIMCWNEIVEMKQSGDWRLRLGCKKRDEKGITRRFSFCLYIAAEQASTLGAKWIRSKSASATVVS